jgi:nitroreductase
MKKIALVSVVFICALMKLPAQDGRAAFALNHYAARNFIAGALSTSELDTVLQAGIRAPSARNSQPWHFTVVRDPALTKRIVPDVAEGNVLIIVSAAGDGKTNGAEILDCGLAAESIYLAAQAIGLGSRIYTGPIDAVNRSLKSDLGFPAGHNAVVLVRVGKAQQVDAASAASSRKAASALVTYK